MLSLAHTLLSLPFAVYVDHPLLIFAGTVGGHFLADTVLHWNIFPDQFKRYPYGLVAADIGLGLIIAWLLLPQQFFSLPVLLAIAGGNVPDVAHGLWDLFGKKYQYTSLRLLAPFFRWHDQIQLETHSFTRGILSQLILIAAAVLVVQAW